MTEQFKRELAAWDLGHESGMDEAEEDGEWEEGWPDDSVDIVDVRPPDRKYIRLVALGYFGLGVAVTSVFWIALIVWARGSN